MRSQGKRENAEQTKTTLAGPPTDPAILTVSDLLPVSFLYGAKEEMGLSRVPPRGAWSPVSARNYPAALAAVFEAAIIAAARKRVG